ncbi:MAG: hypothetical protein IJ493_03130 [Clostridia bacterium]|nr:hypothetical protein [Clostridia bacterium]
MFSRKQTGTLSAVLFLSMLLSACGGSASSNDTTQSTGDTTTEAVTTEEILKPDLPADANYDGYEFTFYMRSWEATYQVVEEELGETINDAIYKRNKTVSELLNVTFATAVDDSNATGAKNSILAGEDAYDVILPHGRYAFSVYAMNSLGLDWHTALPYVDMDQPWWSQDARDNFTVSDKLYAMVGDISYYALGCTKCMLFNKNLFDEYGWDYPYQTVLNGDWTWEKFLEMAIDGSRDLNGDTKLDIENDQMGFATTWWSTPINILFTADQHIASKNENNELVITLNNERTIEVFDNFFKSMTKDGMYIHLADSGTPIYDAFLQGRLLFLETIIDDASLYRDMDDEFGIIPCPKYDETVDEYIAGVDASTSLLVVPITASNTERTSVILEAPAYYGWKDVIPAYYDVALSVKYARDEESVQMMDIIRKGRRFDVGYYINLPINSVGYDLCKREDHSFTSYYASIEASAQAAVEKLNAFYRGE